MVSRPQVVDVVDAIESSHKGDYLVVGTLFPGLAHADVRRQCTGRARSGEGGKRVAVTDPFVGRYIHILRTGNQFRHDGPGSSKKSA